MRAVISKVLNFENYPENYQKGTGLLNVLISGLNLATLKLALHGLLIDL